jgi:hypothetical protein
MRPILETLETRALLSTVIVNTLIDGTFSPSTGIISLRSAIATANASSTPTTITFDPKVFASPQTIVLNGNDFELSNPAEPTTIIGPIAVKAGLASTGNLFGEKTIA